MTDTNSVPGQARARTLVGQLHEALITKRGKHAIERNARKR
jgi:hypothetical protein